MKDADVFDSGGCASQAGGGLSTRSRTSYKIGSLYTKRK